ncbi:MAG TPA: xanthine dehydrogenase family protein subunit M [Bryobacteraceae bacterium]|nr:xanthine dehydrogenase family protein subunit M [Bryobacteraceae bacterium]
MKPASFDYLAPSTVGETLELLERYGEDGKILAGGQSLVPMLNFRLTKFGYLIDINNLAELSYVDEDRGVLRIGALTRHRTIENSNIVAKAAPLLATAAKWVAHPPVRTRGTVGGSLAHCDPAAEYPAVLLALDAKILLRNRTNARLIPADEFIKGVFETALEPQELLTEIQVPVADESQRFGFEEFARRPGDLAVMGIAACLTVRGQRITDARITAFGTEGGACRIIAAEAALVDADSLADGIEWASQAASAVPVQSDVHASAELRSRLASALTRRVLTRALSRRESFVS